MPTRQVAGGGIRYNVETDLYLATSALFTMQIDVFYFATMRTLAGVKQEQINLPVGATVRHLKTHLANRYPEMVEALNTCLVSVDRKLAQPEQVIEEGQEVAIFPPISGGFGSSCPVGEVELVRYGARDQARG